MTEKEKKSRWNEVHTIAWTNEDGEFEVEEFTELYRVEADLLGIEGELKKYGGKPQHDGDEHYFMLIGYREFLREEVKRLRSQKAKEENQNKLIKKAVEIQGKDVHEANTMGFMARSMVVTTMPHKKPLENEYKRTNGNFWLSMMAPKDIGLPYGIYPRLIVAYFTTQAIKTKSRD
ncbi:MAG: hypothetical protein KDI76_14260, partial [Xanthomonadales bacterium]|nr:hypothetical protein [Xanthomonadales bacterium]